MTPLGFFSPEGATDISPVIYRRVCWFTPESSPEGATEEIGDKYRIKRPVAPSGLGIQVASEPGNELPGYYLRVPTGLNKPIYPEDASSLQSTHATIS